MNVTIISQNRFNMVEVNIESCCDDLNFVLNNIFNVIIVNPSSKE